MGSQNNRRGSFDRVVAVLNLDKILSEKASAEKKMKTSIISASDFQNSAFSNVPPVSTVLKKNNGGKESGARSKPNNSTMNAQARSKPNITIATDLDTEDPDMVRVD